MVTPFGQADPEACPSPETFKGWFDDAWDEDDHQISFTKLTTRYNNGDIRFLGGIHFPDHEVIAVKRGDANTPEYAIHEVLHHVRGGSDARRRAVRPELLHD